MRIFVVVLVLGVAGAIVLTSSAAEGQAIAPYVVVLQDGTDVAAKVSELERTHGFKADHRYTSSVSGFAARLCRWNLGSVGCRGVDRTRRPHLA